MRERVGWVKKGGGDVGVRERGLNLFMGFTF